MGQLPYPYSEGYTHCCMCNKPLNVMEGHNPEPLKIDGVCCDSCNRFHVLQARIDNLNVEQDIQNEKEADRFLEMWKFFSKN